MKTIGILYHPRRADSARLAREVQGILQERGVASWQGEADDQPCLGRAAPELELLITLGGDGTIVSASRTLAHAGVPILGINLGRLGFLAEVEPARVREAILAVIDGRYHIETRMMLHAELRRDGKALLETDAVNDVVVARGNVARTVRIAVDVDGHHVITQTADGVIVSTPTGSTAYCLAAGGPIVAPDLRCMVITPIAAHLSVAHALVVPAERLVTLGVIKGQGAMLTVDGQLDAGVKIGDEVYISTSEDSARFVRFGDDGHFYETVLRRLRWPDQDPQP